jgi:hypothetical protein
MTALKRIGAIFSGRGQIGKTIVLVVGDDDDLEHIDSPPRELPFRLFSAVYGACGLPLYEAVGNHIDLQACAATIGRLPTFAWISTAAPINSFLWRHDSLRDSRLWNWGKSTLASGSSQRHWRLNGCFF